MEAVFIFLRNQTCVQQEEGQKGEEVAAECQMGGEAVAECPTGGEAAVEGKSDNNLAEYEYSPERSEELENILLKIFQTHLLTSDRLCHIQFLVFYPASKLFYLY